MLIVAGLSLNNLKPRVWDPSNTYHLPDLRAVMVSYADFHRKPASRQAAMEQGLRQSLGIPREVKVYLDNGAFWFTNGGASTRCASKGARKAYEEFVSKAKPDWAPVPVDFIPTPSMIESAQNSCYKRTMAANRTYSYNGYVPVIHISRFLEDYLVAVQADSKLSSKPSIALGGIVPNLLRASKAMAYDQVLEGMIRVREAFRDKTLHVFGVGGTATLHLTALLGIDSVDSSGWRNRAARGLVQLPGRGDRMVANLGSWRGRAPNLEEWQMLENCACPACAQFSRDGLQASGMAGFCNRATHNLWVLLREAVELETRINDGSYHSWFESHLDNSTYLRLIRKLVSWRALRSQ